MQKNKNILRKLACLIFGVSWIVWVASTLLDWGVGKNAMLLCLMMFCALNWRKINDLSDEMLPENPKITPDNAAQILQKSRRLAWFQGALFAILFYGLIVSHNAQYAWGALFFVLPAGGIVAWAFYANAKKRIHTTLRDNKAP